LIDSLGLSCPRATSGQTKGRPKSGNSRQAAQVHVRVDEKRCEGHGRCYAIAPELFQPDDLGNGHETGDGLVPPDLADKAHSAVANCPERAISIEEET
jgi:ferredoxin